MEKFNTLLNKASLYKLVDELEEQYVTNSNTYNESWERAVESLRQHIDIADEADLKNIAIELFDYVD